MIQMSVFYGNSQTPTTTMITSKGVQHEIKAPYLTTRQTLTGSSRDSVSFELEADKILNQIRSRSRQATPSRTFSSSPAPSRRSSSANRSPSHFLTTSTPSTISYLTRSGAGPPRPNARMSSLPPIPPTLPKVVKHHYPLPPPSFTDAMISVSKRLRNRSVSPSPQYAALQVAGALIQYGSYKH